MKGCDTVGQPVHDVRAEFVMRSHACSQGLHQCCCSLVWLAGLMLDVHYHSMGGSKWQGQHLNAIVLYRCWILQNCKSMQEPKI